MKDNNETPKQGRLPAPGFEKLYYSIGEVASILDVNPSLIRYWEEQFEILHPKRNRKGNRLYTQDDVERLHLIYHLLKTKGYTLKGAKDAMKTDMSRMLKEREIMQRLKDIKQSLLALKEELQAGENDLSQK